MELRTALVTGASRGIGQATAMALDRLGWRVLAGYRDPVDGERIASAGSERLIPIQLDVTDPESVTAAADQVRELAGGATPALHGLVNNAGIVVAGPLEFIPTEWFRTQLEVNLIGVVTLSQALLPFLRQARGRIVNVSSVNGRLVTPFGGPYAASKFALEAVTDAFRIELRRWGVYAVLIEPGAVATPIWDTTRRRASEIAAGFPPEARTWYGSVMDAIGRVRAPRRALAPERVAAVIARALTSRRPRPRYVVGWDARLGLLLQSMLPTTWMDALLAGRRRHE